MSTLPRLRHPTVARSLLDVTKYSVRPKQRRKKVFNQRGPLLFQGKWRSFQIEDMPPRATSQLGCSSEGCTLGRCSKMARPSVGHIALHFVVSSSTSLYCLLNCSLLHALPVSKRLIHPTLYHSIYYDRASPTEPAFLLYINAFVSNVGMSFGLASKESARTRTHQS